MKEKLKWLSPTLVAAALVAVAYCLLKNESDYLWKAQELNLFLDTPLYLKELAVKSGWLLSWLGSYFTEFFYRPWLGVAMLVGWWLLLIVAMGRTFRVPMKWAVVLLIPVAALLVTDVDLGYWLYYLKLRGHFFVATIGTTLAVAAVWLFRLLLGREAYIAQVSATDGYAADGCVGMAAGRHATQGPPRDYRRGTAVHRHCTAGLLQLRILRDQHGKHLPDGIATV